jgi:HAD superfamily hydrolase (TIGR01509 family)
MSTMKLYRYILLDWDGNLAKTLDLWLGAFRIVLNEEGYFPTDHEIASSFGKVDEYFAKLGAQDPTGLFARANAIGAKKLPEVELYPDALEVIQYLKTLNKPMALITSSPRANVEHLLVKYGMQELFEAVIVREDVTYYKPHPESLQTALTRLGGSAVDALMIGDSDKDLGAAVNAGIDSVLFYPPEHKKFYKLEDLKRLHPTFIVEDFKDIMRIIAP